MKTYTKDEIISEVIDLRLKKMMSTRNILKYLEDKYGFGMTQRYEYLKWARETIGEQYSKTNPQAIEEAIAQYEEQIEKVKDNPKLWNELKRELNKIQGLYAPDKHEVTITNFKANFPDMNNETN